MSEWKEFTGSPEQIEEIQNSKHGYCVRMADEEGAASCLVFYDDSQLDRLKTDTAIFQYLIAEPHPLEDMICQQARTGQDVFVHIAGTIYANYIAHRAAQDMDYFHSYYNKKLEATTYITKKPNWHIPGAQYSFTRFGGYRANK